MSETNLKRLFEAQILEIADAAWPTKWFGLPFDPALSDDGLDQYQAVFLNKIPATQNDIGGRGPRLIGGTCQVSLFIRADADRKTVTDRADVVLAQFPRGKTGLEEGSTRIWIDVAWAASAIEEPKWYQIPVLIRFAGFD